MTNERQRAGGSYAEGRNTIFALCQKGHKPLNLFSKKKPLTLTLSPFPQTKLRVENP